MKADPYTYISWEAMKARCLNPNHEKYSKYGGAGIVICDRWLTFANFFEDMGVRPFATTLDRKDNKLGYFKENCRWASATDQQLNKGDYRNNVTGRKGVHWHKAAQKWFARGTKNKKIYELYYGDSYEDAVKAREAWENQHVLK